MFRCLVRFSLFLHVSPDCLFLARLSRRQREAGYPPQYCDAYGLASWPKGEQIRATPSTWMMAQKLARSWTWDREDERITMKAQTVPASQRRFLHSHKNMRPGRS